jgi:hypothetical protein
MANSASRRLVLDRFNSLEIGRDRALGDAYVVTRLQIHPEADRRAKEFRQPQRGVRGTPQALAILYGVSAMGFMNSSRSISPGCIGGSFATIFMMRPQR